MVQEVQHALYQCIVRLAPRELIYQSGINHFLAASLLAHCISLKDLA
jgi:hypothetical protein